MKPLQELRRAIAIIGEETPLSSALADWHNFFLPQLERMQFAQGHPHVLRILAEDAVFQAGAILAGFEDEHAAVWERYLAAADSGELLAPEYRRYLICSGWVRRFTLGSYDNEVSGPDEKSRRYAYVLKKPPLSGWFESAAIAGIVEEIITVYCLVWFSAMDYENERRMAMEGYLTPEIGKAVAQLAQTCDDLTRQVLIRELTKKTQEWCKGDPELADLLLEEKKSLEGCVKYVLEQAAAAMAKNVVAMPKEEFNMLPTRMIGSQRATMAGGAVAAEQAFQWAHDYYYKVKETVSNGGKGKTGQSGQKKGGKKAAAAAKSKQDKAGDATGADADAAPSEKSDAGGASGQMSLFGGGKAAA